MTDGAGRHHPPHLGLEGQTGHPSRAQWRGCGSLEKGESGRGPAEGTAPPTSTPACLWVTSRSPAPSSASLCTQPQQTWIWCSHSQILGTRSSLGGRGAGPTLLLGATKGDSAQPRGLLICAVFTHLPSHCGLSQNSCVVTPHRTDPAK